MYLGRFTPQQHLQFEVIKRISSFPERSLSLEAQSSGVFPLQSCDSQGQEHAEREGDRLPADTRLLLPLLEEAQIQVALS